jgi:hypothetical protein
VRASDRARVRLMPRTKHQHRYNTIVSLKGHMVRYGCDHCSAVDPYRYFMTDPINDILKSYAPASTTIKARAVRKAIAQAVQTVSAPLKTSGWLSGSEGSVSDPQGPNAAVVVLPLETSPEEIDAARNALKQTYPPRQYVEGDDGVLMKFDVLEETLTDSGTRVIDNVKIDSISLDPHGLGQIESVTPIDPDEEVRFLNGGRGDEGYEPAPEVPAVTLPETDVHLDPEHPHADLPEPTAEVFYSEAQLVDMTKDEVYAVAAKLNIPGRSAMKKAGLVTAILGVQENSFKSADSPR